MQGNTPWFGKQDRGEEEYHPGIPFPAGLPVVESSRVVHGCTNQSASCHWGVEPEKSGICDTQPHHL